MASSKHWALYATNHHLGTYREHRLSALRIRSFMVELGWSQPAGWKAEVGLGRFHVAVSLAPRRDDPRVQAWWNWQIGRMNINEGLADSDDGRLFAMDTDAGPGRPQPSWKADDPQQPIGWRHDGERWVQKDGWWRDRDGTWRYNEPGDPGWRQLPDSSWEYVFAENGVADAEAMAAAAQRCEELELALRALLRGDRGAITGARELLR